MEGQIPENWIPLFKPQLKEEFVYYIKFFQVHNARATYCPVDHPYMMRFTAHTKVHEVKNVQDTFPKYACAPATYDVLRSRVGITKYCSGNTFFFCSSSNHFTILIRLTLVPNESLVFSPSWFTSM